MAHHATDAERFRSSVRLQSLTYTLFVCMLEKSLRRSGDSVTKRINIVLPDDTLRLLDKVAARGNRSRLISEAVRHYLSSKARRNLAARLKQGAMVNAQRDLDIAQQWFSVDEEAWPTKRSATGKT